MKCPKCKGKTKVTNHSPKSKGGTIATERYRVCVKCGFKFKTRESIIYSYKIKKRREKDAEGNKV